MLLCGIIRLVGYRRRALPQLLNPLGLFTRVREKLIIKCDNTLLTRITPRVCGEIAVSLGAFLMMLGLSLRVREKFHLRCWCDIVKIPSGSIFGSILDAVTAFVYNVENAFWECSRVRKQR